jgi:hypothetical protein
MSALTAIGKPNTGDLKDLQRFLGSSAMGPAKLNGPDAKIWGSVTDQHNRCEDLICIVRPEKEDPFSRWCLDKVMAAFFACGGHRFRKPDKVTGAIVYQRDKILRITYYITTALSSLLLILSITILWVVTSMSARLALIASLNLVVSLCLAVFTTAQRPQVFAITAAYVTMYYAIVWNC